jgi:hypothetical protein
MLASLLRHVGRIRQFWAESLRHRHLLRAHAKELGRPESEVRGIRLLREWLSTEQLGLFDKQGYFEVTGGQTGRRYRIRYGTATNIHELDRYGHPTVGWCFVPNEPLVPGDVMLAQKIALETDELGALAVAKQFSPSWY